MTKSSSRILKFLSTPSGWRATRPEDFAHQFNDDFYPRPPGGGRPESVSGRTCSTLFLSTPSGWRATRAGQQLLNEFVISIHALRVEGDDGYIQLYARTHRFLSTPSGWRATL